jgi:hypothetical protein
VPLVLSAGRARYGMLLRAGVGSTRREVLLHAKTAG